MCNLPHFYSNPVLNCTGWDRWDQCTIIRERELYKICTDLYIGEIFKWQMAKGKKKKKRCMKACTSYATKRCTIKGEQWGMNADEDARMYLK